MLCPIEHKMKELSLELKECSSVLWILGNEYRQQIIWEILESGCQGVPLSLLLQRVSLSRAATLKHLSIMKKAGMIISSKENGKSFYTLDSTCQGWRQLALLAGHTQSFLKNVHSEPVPTQCRHILRSRGLLTQPPGGVPE